MKNCWHGNKLRTDNGNQYVLEKKDKFGRIFLRKNTANVPLIVTARRRLDEFVEYLREIVIADGYDWFTFGAVTLIMSILFIPFIIIPHIEVWHFLLFTPVYGLLAKLVHCSLYNLHKLTGAVFIVIAVTLYVLLIIGANDVSTSFEQISEPERIATAEVYVTDDGSTVCISDATVVTDDGTMMSADDFFDMNGHVYVSGGNNEWLSVKVDDGIDTPYLSVLTTTFSSDRDKMGFAGKMLDGLFHYSEHESNETSVVLYVPDGMTVDYGDRE